MGKPEIQIDESLIDESEEVQEALARYEEDAAKLLEIIARRDEMAKLLKIAQPSKIAEVRECIANLDSLIEDSEVILEMDLQLIEQNRDLVRDYLKLDAMCDIIKPALLKHVAENNPEKLEQLEAMLSDDDKTH